jgi:hypothetical protein
MHGPATAIQMLQISKKLTPTKKPADHHRFSGLSNSFSTYKAISLAAFSFTAFGCSAAAGTAGTAA